MLWLYILIAFILISLIGHFGAIYLIFLRYFARLSDKKINKSIRKTSYSKPYMDELYRYKNELINTPYEIKEITSFDGLKLKGYYYSNKSDKTIIMVHGFHTEPFFNFAYQAQYFLAHHYNVLIIVQRAHGISEGKYSTYGQKESKDVLSWIEYIAQDNNIKDIYLYGISMGATSIAFASENILEKKVRCLIIESVFTSIDELVEHLLTSQHIPSFFFKGSVRFLSKKLAGIKWNEKRTVDALKNNHVPSIFVHGTKDIVAIDSFFEDNYNNCFSNKYRIIVKNAPHALCALKDKEKYLDQLEKILGENHG